ncbi:MAG TPA: four helix bundle protein [Polyangiales bacterium]|nr:four helix bundle protein [Polyangiales bacterium]
MGGDGDVHDPRQPKTSQPDIPAMLSFQKMDVYRRAVDFGALSVAIIGATPRGHAGLRDQLRRAAFSISLNIAEGAGRMSDADAARHYGIARGSAMECAAVLDHLQALGVVQDDKYRRGIELLERLVAMLTKLCR